MITGQINAFYNFRTIFYIGTLLLFVLINNSCCKKTISKEFYNDDLNEVVSLALNSEMVYYTVKKEYPNLLEQDMVFLKNDWISNVNFDSIKFLDKPILVKSYDDLLESKNPNFFYFFHIKISQDLARIDIIHKFSPTIRIFLEKYENEWIVLNCVTIYHINYKSHNERDLLNEIIYKIEKDTVF